MAKRYKNDDPVTSTFESVGDSIPSSVVNASGAPSSLTLTQPRGRSGGAYPPGTGDKVNRRPIQIDAVTGQRLADGVNADLDAAARHPEVDPYEMSAGEMRERFESRWSNVNLKRGAMASAIQDASDSQYVPIPGLVDRARSGYASPHEVGMHVSASMQADHYLGRIFGNPGSEDCNG